MDTDKKSLDKAKTFTDIDIDDIVDCMVMVDFWNKISNSNDTGLVVEVHRIIGTKIVDAVVKWREDPLFSDVLNRDGAMLTTYDYHKDKGEILVVDNTVGIIKEVRLSKYYKIFITHTTNLETIPIMAIQK